jgi:hypothetical protein
VALDDSELQKLFEIEKARNEALDRLTATAAMYHEAKEAVATMEKQLYSVIYDAYVAGVDFKDLASESGLPRRKIRETISSFLTFERILAEKASAEIWKASRASKNPADLSPEQVAKIEEDMRSIDPNWSFPTEDD